MYVKLEPCCHTGRTGPCTKAIIDAGSCAWSCAMQDPNPRGWQGFRASCAKRDAGQHRRRRRTKHAAQRGFCALDSHRPPLVTLKSALTLDGQIASGPARIRRYRMSDSRASVQRLAPRGGCVVTGIGTVLVDDPLLTDRTGEPRRRKILRVVVDSDLRISPKSKLVKSADSDVLVPHEGRNVAESSSVGKRRRRSFARESETGARQPERVLKELGRREMLNVLLEAGAELNGAALEG